MPTLLSRTYPMGGQFAPGLPTGSRAWWHSATLLIGRLLNRGQCATLACRPLQIMLTFCHPAQCKAQGSFSLPEREMTGAEFRKIRVDRLGFTVAEAAVMFGCDERTVKRWQADTVRIPGSVALALTA